MKFLTRAPNNKLSGPPNFTDALIQKDLNASREALFLKYLYDIGRRTIAKKLAKRFFVIRNPVLLDERDEILRCVTCQRRLREMRIRRKKILGGTVDVRKIAAAAAGN